MVTRTGECIYCGQQSVVQVVKGTTEHEINIQATIQCECEESEPYTKRDYSIVSAKAAIETIFSGMKDTEKILKLALDYFIYGLVKEVTVSQGDVKAKISLSSNNKIKVERVEKTKETEEF